MSDLLHTIKRLTPAPLRLILRKTYSSVRYLFVRSLGNIMFPFIGASSPLRGYYARTEEYARSNHGQIIFADRSQIDDLNAMGKSQLLMQRALDSCNSASIFVARIPFGRVVKDYGATITPDHRLLADVSPPMGGPASSHAILQDLSLPPVTRINGTVAVLSSHAHQRYFHWMFDILPRLDILRRASIAVDFFVLNAALPYQQETIARLGIPIDQIISPSFDTHIEASELIVPSLPGPIGTVARRSCQFLRETFMDSTAPNQATKVLYISRSDALTRRVLNQDELIERMKKYGVEVVQLDHLSVAEQVELFSKAKLVVGPHGAGFTNSVFSNSHTAIVEFMPSTYYNPCFKNLARLRSLQYACVNGRSSSTTTHDMYVDALEMERAIEQAVK